jgi:hypothetical protein
MICLSYLLFLCFIKLHNSFKLTSYMNTSYMNRKSHNKLSMVCDYYIEERLCVYYNDNSCYCIELNKKRGYYTDTDIFNDFMIDMDIENSNLTELEKNIQYHLKPISPFIIYNNNAFTNIHILNKYKDLLESVIINIDYKTWDDITEIVLLEERYKRY